MYPDYAPIPNPPCEKVLVLERGDSAVEDVIEGARDCGATTVDGDGDEIFWLVFEEEPKRLWDFKEDALRSSLKSRGLS